MYGKKDKNDLSVILNNRDLEMSIFLSGIQLKRRGLMIAAIPSFTLFAWYHIFSYCVLKFIVDESTRAFPIWYASFYFLVSFTLILGGSFIRRIEKTFVIYSWALFSPIGTVIISFAPTVMTKLAIYLLLAVLFGIALLAFLAFFWDLTVSEERGRVAGLVTSISLSIFPLVIFLVYNLDFFTTAMVCIILNLGTLTIEPLKANGITMLTGKKALGGINPEKRTILLYSIPWVIFSLINATLAKSISFHIVQGLSSSSVIFLGYLEIVAGGSGAIIGGVIADFFGRRLSLTFGLTLYGISSAVSGLATGYGFLCASHIGIGLTWGILLTLYLSTIWGDLATLDTCFRRYSIGLAIFYSAAGVGALFAPQLFQISLIVASIASCLLIFLSNIPLVLAPELLRSDFREEIRLKLYVTLVKRIIKSRKDIAGQSREC